MKRRTTKADRKVITAIAKRAVSIATQYGDDYDQISAEMDILSGHEDVGLRLKELLDADDFNFIHDAFGIRKHMDRTAYPGNLTDCFRPRFAA